MTPKIKNDPTCSSRLLVIYIPWPGLNIAMVMVDHLEGRAQLGSCNKPLFYMACKPSLSNPSITCTSSSPKMSIMLDIWCSCAMVKFLHTNSALSLLGFLCILFIIFQYSHTYLYSNMALKVLTICLSHIGSPHSFHHKACLAHADIDSLWKKFHGDSPSKMPDLTGLR